MPKAACKSTDLPEITPAMLTAGVDVLMMYLGEPQTSRDSIESVLIKTLASMQQAWVSS